MAKQTWGRWAYHSSTQELVHTQPHYAVDLGRCGTSEAVLDWIAQVAGKTWATDADVGALVRALDDQLHLQATLCSLGMLLPSAYR